MLINANQCKCSKDARQCILNERYGNQRVARVLTSFPMRSSLFSRMPQGAIPIAHTFPRDLEEWSFKASPTWRITPALQTDTTRGLSNQGPEQLGARATRAQATRGLSHQQGSTYTDEAALITTPHKPSDNGAWSNPLFDIAECVLRNANLETTINLLIRLGIVIC